MKFCPKKKKKKKKWIDCIHQMEGGAHHDVVLYSNYGFSWNLTCSIGTDSNRTDLDNIAQSFLQIIIPSPTLNSNVSISLNQIGHQVESYHHICAMEIKDNWFEAMDFLILKRKSWIGISRSWERLNTLVQIHWCSFSRCRDNSRRKNRAEKRYWDRKS